MNNRLALVASATVFIFLSTVTVSLAHHSFSSIWNEKVESQITGTLSKVQWINPHSYFEVEVTNDDGSIDTFSFENFPPVFLRNLGLSRNMMTSRIGETVTVLYNPARDGTPTIGYGRVFQFSDGPTIMFTGSTTGFPD